PVFVLVLELAPATVEVNVDSPKHEVGFRDNRSVHDFIFSSLHRALAQVKPADSLNKNGAGTILTQQAPAVQGLAAGEFQGQERISFATSQGSRPTNMDSAYAP